MNSILSNIFQIFNQFSPCVFVEVIQATKRTPCKAGFKMVVDSNGRLDGSVGGGILEKTCIDIAKNMIKNNEKINVYNFNLQNDNPINQYKIDQNDLNIDLTNLLSNNAKIRLNSCCGGSVTIFFELFTRLSISIFGAGHIGKALSQIVMDLGYSIQIFDVREDAFWDYNVNNNIKTYKLEPKLVNQEQHFFVGDKPLSTYLNHDEYIVITTHGHLYDFSIAKYIINLDKKFSYIGMIGSKNKVKEFVNNLKIENPKIFEKLKDSNFYSPIGLDIGGVSAKEIALSIAAQIQAIRYSKKAVDLSIINKE